MSLVVRNLTKRFTARGTPAVADVSFDAPHGGITTLLGPSGSGKSTVLRMVAGLEQPDTGSVVFGDQDFTFMPAQRRGIGFVFQSSLRAALVEWRPGQTCKRRSNAAWARPLLRRSPPRPAR